MSKPARIPRRTPVRKKRPGVRRGQPSPAEKKVLREFIYELSAGRCELGLGCCDGQPLPWDGSIFERWHLVHVKAKRRFGWPVEGPDRMRGGCYQGHIVEMHEKGRKPVPLLV
jgi:hypothetical protein